MRVQQKLSSVVRSIHRFFAHTVIKPLMFCLPSSQECGIVGECLEPEMYDDESQRHDKRS